jgi:hypothetical protein
MPMKVINSNPATFKGNPMTLPKKSRSNSVTVKKSKARKVENKAKALSLPAGFSLLRIGNYDYDNQQALLFKLGRAFVTRSATLSDAKKDHCDAVSFDPGLVSPAQRITRMTNEDLFSDELLISLEFDAESVYINFLHDEDFSNNGKKVQHDTSFRYDNQEQIVIDQKDFFEKIQITKEKFLALMQRRSHFKASELEKFLELILEAYCSY